jgi:hypothetical protein
VVHQRDGNWSRARRNQPRARADRSLRLRGRLESERPPLIRPGHRQVDETLETKAAWQASFDCRLDDLRREESERQGHPDRTHSLVLPRSDRLQRQAGSERSASSQRCASRPRSGSRARWRASGGHRSLHLPGRRLFKSPRLRKSQCATTASRISTDSRTSPFGVRNGIDK